MAMMRTRRGDVGRRRGGLVGTVGLALLLAAWAPGATAVEPRVACALPYVQSQPNFFCSDLHQVLFFTDGFDSNTDTIYAELLAVDEQGTVLDQRQVHAGDFVRMTSFNNSQLAR